MLHRIGARYLDIIGVEHVIDRDRAARDGVLENPGQRGAGLHGAGDEFGVFVVDRPQSVFDFFLELCTGRLETRLHARFRFLAGANPARADALHRGIERLIQRQRLGLRPADQDAFQGNLIDRRRDRAGALWISILMLHGSRSRLRRSA